LYEGGFLVVALAAGAVITSVTSWRGSVLARFLSLPPLTYIGRISYGLYLYHWPLFLALDHAHTGLSGASLLAVRLCVTIVCAVVSFHLVEQPIRRGYIAREWRGIPLAAGGAIATAAVVIIATVPPAFASVPASLLKGSSGVPAAEHDALTAVHAFTSDPIRFLMVGDSVALTAAIGLSSNSIEDYGVDVINDGVLGCDLDPFAVRFSGVAYGSPECGNWPRSWATKVATIRPQVVGLIMGRFEVMDHFYDGTWVHVGEPAWDAHLLDDLDRAVATLSAGGAHVVIFTYPYVDPPLEQPNGDLWPENLPSRMDEWNSLLRQVAAEHPITTTLIDLNRMLDPAGHYTMVIDGIDVRYPDDGIHVTRQGGEWLRPLILPEVAKLGLRVTLIANASPH
jgi:hypothetical protein